MDVEAKRKQARELRAQGKTYSDIGQQLGVPLSTVAGWCKDVKEKRWHPGRQRKERLLPKVIELYSKGISIPRIAEVLQIPAPTLHEWYRDSGLPKNKRTAYVTDDLRERIRRKMTVDPDGKLRKKAVGMYVDKEMTTTEIAEKLNVTSVTIGQWLQQEGIARRQSPLLRTREKLREANLGEKRYNWKGGISKENRRHRLSMYMRDARKACFERDDYTCRSCGQRGGKLNAHHVWPFQRWSAWKYEVWNLVTLCKTCHDNWHKAAGGHVKVAIGPFFAA